MQVGAYHAVTGVCDDMCQCIYCKGSSSIAAKLKLMSETLPYGSLKVSTELKKMLPLPYKSSCIPNSPNIQDSWICT